MKHLIAICATAFSIQSYAANECTDILDRDLEIMRDAVSSITQLDEYEKEVFYLRTLRDDCEALLFVKELLYDYALYQKANPSTDSRP